jgi:hypothetical protein
MWVNWVSRSNVSAKKLLELKMNQAKRAAGAREGSKAAKVLSLLSRPDGASLKELMKATGWLAHSVRGYLSRTVANRMGLDLVPEKKVGGDRRYFVKS